MKKIFIYCPGGGYGISLYTYNLIKSLNEKNKEVVLFTSKDFEFKNGLENVRTILNQSYSNSKNKIIKKFLTAFNSINGLLKIIKSSKELENNIIHFMRVFYYTDFILLKFLKRSELILTVHDVIPLSFILNEKLDLYFLKLSYKHFDKLIVHSIQNKKELIDVFGIKEDKIKVIEHGIEDELFVSDTIKSEFIFTNGIDTKLKTILFFGILRNNKGIDVLIEALNEIEEEYNIIFAGKAANNTIDQMINDFILKSKKANVIYMNRFIKENEVPILFNISDFTVLPYTTFHSQSGVLSQAISYKLPVIVTNLGAMPEIVEKYSLGVIVEPSNTIQLKKEIQYFLNNDLSNYKKNFLKCKDDFSWEAIANKTIDFYDSSYLYMGEDN